MVTPAEALGDVPISVPRTKEHSVETLVGSPSVVPSFGLRRLKSTTPPPDSDSDEMDTTDTIELESAIREADAVIRHNGHSESSISDFSNGQLGQAGALPPLPVGAGAERFSASKSQPRPLGSQATLTSLGSNASLTSSVGFYASKEALAEVNGKVDSRTTGFREENLAPAKLAPARRSIWSVLRA